MGYIYKIVNDENNKVYVGKTHRPIKVRFNEHIDKAKNAENKPSQDTIFYKELRTIGFEHFSIEELEYVEDDDKLTERESYWISQYDSYNSGYNSSFGGEGGDPIYDYNFFKELWDNGYTVNEIAEEIGCNRNTVYYALSTFPGWTEEAKEIQAKNCMKAMNDARKIKVNCYDLKGKFLKTYESSREAAKELDIAESNISHAINHSDRKRVGDFLFTKYGEPTPPPYVRTGSKGVNQYDLKGNFINTYNSLREAAISIGKNKTSAGNIGKVCRGERETAYGYKWKWSGEDA